MDTNAHESENKAFPLEFRMPEVHNDANLQSRGSQVIDNLASLKVGDSFYDFVSIMTASYAIKSGTKSPTLSPL